MGVDAQERRLHEADLAAARAREEKSRAARNNALHKGYMRPDLAGPRIDRFYKNRGADELRNRFYEDTGPSVFGVKRGNPLTREGRAQRAEANEARRDLPDLWDAHAQDRKNLEAAERAYATRYGPQPNPTRNDRDEYLVVAPDMRDQSKASCSDYDALRFLHEETDHLEEVLGSLDKDSASAIARHKDGTRLKDNIIEYLEEIAARKQEYGFKLGELTARIEQLEERVNERERQEMENDRNRQTLAVLEDHLDWFDIEVRPLTSPSEEDPSHEQVRSPW
ncbi:hypothetical protein PVA19_11185 [Agrobacterium sp. CNPSo 3708]|uniref:hypothetical protein n=1 Tax=Agrobacterium sp. CNPSo 3708 TaxID=3028150 RepID=UPI0023647393|nr:hypothetical protein [Agrobacterium sp. CNPSo 3708]MDD1498975.1 hypothetical protein [Agrobacterium sp. CNPSo 3708]